MKRILVVNVNWMGDVLFSTPAIRALRKKFPEAHIACMVPPRCADLLANNPYLNEIIVYRGEDSLLSLFQFLRAARELRRRRFDTVIFFHRSKTKAFLARLAGIPERVGYATPHNRLLTRAIPLPRAGLHRTDIFLNLIQSLEIPADGRTPDFFPKKEAGRELAALLEACGVASGAPYAVVHAGGNWDLKRWPAGFFAEWIRLFLKEYPWKILLCGTKPEEPLVREIQSHLSGDRVVSVCGQTSVDTLALLLRGAQFLLSNDSGPLHLAASQRTKILGLFGPTAPAETGPFSEGEALILHKDVGCEIPCYFRSCNTRVCMDWLTPQEVFAKTKELLAA